MAVLPRYYCAYDDNCYYSSWDNWGRWVAFAVIVGCAFLVFFFFACFNARRRRARGRPPIAGTAWMAPPPGPPPPNQPIYQQAYHGNDPNYPAQPPPQYSANPQNYGYFGAQGTNPQQNGIEMQPPPHTYAGGGREYEPPMGPPPAKA
ncbi:Chitin synthesis regulation Congo red resistance RCR protein [Penicillium maclennaniae]|uniref:Chitin synthesis regulation Congo red resistance RCR protein n=1 Tax=Penicillium maclennaniae TaxID=1343394 RepID=UPI00253FFD16|nr:Chitin synthesis regulation Congo red resistance RCR protein [Penicillium maclennaniae]KAJ5670032.1 Chitin synthesis regulation Congo red resistance RCR protein [Penicillium maclennaniae]